MTQTSQGKLVCLLPPHSNMIICLHLQRWILLREESNPNSDGIEPCSSRLKPEKRGQQNKSKWGKCFPQITIYRHPRLIYILRSNSSREVRDANSEGIVPVSWLRSVLIIRKAQECESNFSMPSQSGSSLWVCQNFDPIKAENCARSNGIVSVNPLQQQEPSHQPNKERSLWIDTMKPFNKSQRLLPLFLINAART